MPRARVEPRPVSLTFAKDVVKRHPDLPRNLSAVELTGDDLWLGSDEGTTIERLSRKSDDTFGRHESIELSPFLALPAADQELDIEGLAFDGAYLWITGSHSLKRERPSIGKSAGAIEQLGRMVRETNRYILARIPCVRDPQTGRFTLYKQTIDPRDPTATLTAAQLFGT
ncbi:MAG TPA: DUF3616 domain-containing protein, partial [Luteitalea sp.]|nr:DUF3616 domain-containing protein [Luteitalea sp.]